MKLVDKLYILSAIIVLFLSVGLLFGLDNRSDFAVLMSYFTLAFLAYAMLIRADLKPWHFLAIAIALRIPSLFFTPYLSDDIYRYLWDGALMHQGISPFAMLPSEWMAGQPSGDFQDLYPLLNSPNYFSIYPPISQLFFYISASFGFPASLKIFQVIVCLFEFGTLYILYVGVRRKLFANYLLPVYGLCPLVIVELCGSLHSEVFLMFALVLFYYAYQQKKVPWMYGALLIAILTKLWPLLLLPLMLRVSKLKYWFSYSFLTMLIVAVSFMPFFWGVDLNGFLSSFSLYFKTFEFNASLYYLYRHWGYLEYGWNIIAEAGPNLQLITLAVLLYFFAHLLSKKWEGPHRVYSLPDMFFYVYMTYQFCATTVQPWYVLPALMFSAWTGRLSGIVWAFTCFFSYHVYVGDQWQESTTVSFLEYIPVYALFLYELWSGRRLLKGFIAFGFDLSHTRASR